MSIAKKLTTIAENTPKVYNKGFENGKNSVVDIGKYAKTITFSSLNVFGKANVELNFDNLTSLANLVRLTQGAYKNTMVEHLVINCSTQITSMQEMLYSNGSSSDDTVLKKLTFNVDTSKCTNFVNTFMGRRGLEIIDGIPFDFSAVTNNLNGVFKTCYALKDFRVKPSCIKVSFSIADSGDLSTDTIQSIIDGLVDLTGGTAQTLTLHADVGAKLTDEQKATITTKNWELVY